jgi:hypothetical protein
MTPYTRDKLGKSFRALLFVVLIFSSCNHFIRVGAPLGPIDSPDWNFAPSASKTEFVQNMNQFRIYMGNRVVSLASWCPGSSESSCDSGLRYLNAALGLN